MPIQKSLPAGEDMIDGSTGKRGLCCLLLNLVGLYRLYSPSYMAIRYGTKIISHS